MSRNKLIALFLISAIAVLSGTVAYAQTTVGMGMHQTTPTLPDDPSTIFQSHLNNIMGIPYNNTAGEMVTPDGYDSSEKHYMDAVGFQSNAYTFICPNGVEAELEGSIYQTHRSPMNIAEHNNGHAGESNFKLHWNLSNIKFEVMHVDIHEGIYHLSGIVKVGTFNQGCGNVDVETMAVFDLIGLCDGSEAHITVREADSWSMRFDDSQHSAACLTAPSP